MPAFKDYNAELKVLQQRQRDLRVKHAQQLGELVIAIGADLLSAEILAGALLAAVASTDKVAREGWSVHGAAFFQGRTRPARRRARAQPKGGAERERGGSSD